MNWQAFVWCVCDRVCLDLKFWQEMKKRLCRDFTHLSRNRMNEQNFTYTSLVHTDIMLGTGQKVLGGGPEERGGGL